MVLAALALPLLAATIIGRDQIASTVYTLVLAVPITTALAAIVVSASGSAAKVPPSNQRSRERVLVATPAR